jgi:hypothetical protein
MDIHVDKAVKLAFPAGHINLQPRQPEQKCSRDRRKHLQVLKEAQPAPYHHSGETAGLSHLPRKDKHHLYFPGEVPGNE